MKTFDLLAPYAITRGFPWKLALTRLQSRTPRVPVDLTGMTARLEIYDTQHCRRPPWTFDSATGHIALVGATGEVDIRLSAADTQGIAATACRYRIVFAGAAGAESIFLRGRLAVLEAWQ